MRKFLAFTLAETLIVMGVIGIVSALTLPNLNSSTGEKEKVAKVKKIYSNLNDALGRAVAVYGPLEEWMQASDSTAALQSTRFAERLTEFMKISKNCTVLTSGVCFPTTAVKHLSGSTTDSFTSNASVYKFLVADGAAVAASWSDNRIFVDIDGPNKGKNTFGVDLFMFPIDRANDALQPGNGVFGISEVLSTGNGAPVTSWVLSFDNMDYLKANTTGKCSNSNITLNALANPPIVSCK